jgi:hypothetical protein
MATLTAEQTKNLTARDDAQKQDDPLLDNVFHGQKSALSGQGYADEPDYRTGKLSFLGLGDTVNRMDNPITEDELANPIIAQVVQSPEFLALDNSDDRQRMLVNAVQSSNLALFESKGEEFTPRMPNINANMSMGATYGTEMPPNEPDEVAGVRYQTTEKPMDNWRTEKTGETSHKETLIIPPPDSTATGRSVKGAILQALRGIVSLPEYLSDRGGFTDRAENSTFANFPVYTAASEGEEIIQDVGELVASSFTGVGLVNGLMKAPKIANTIGNAGPYFAKVFNLTKGTANGGAATTALINSTLRGSGALLAETFTANTQGNEPFVGDILAEKIGVEGDSFTGHLLDGATFIVGIKALGQVVKGIGWAGSKVLPAKSPIEAVRQRELAISFLYSVDPELVKGVDKVPLAELARRASILGEVLSTNATFKSALTEAGEVTLDSVTAMQMGAEEYYRRVYAWREALSESPEAWEATVKTGTDEFILNLGSVREGMAQGSSAVQVASGRANAQVANILGDAAETAIDGGTRQSEELFQSAADPLADSINTTRGAVDVAQTAFETSTKNLGDQQTVVQTILNNNADLLGSTADEVSSLGNALGDDLLSSWMSSKQAYEGLFKAIPDDIPLDIDALVRGIDEIFPENSPTLDFVTANSAKADPVRYYIDLFKPQMIPDPDDAEKMVRESSEQLIERIQSANEGFSLKKIYTEIRPLIGNRISAIKGTDQAGAIPYLTKVKELIDEMVDATGDDSFVAAKDAVQNHLSTYTPIKEMAVWENTARGVRGKVDEAGDIVPSSDRVPTTPASNRPMGYDDAMIEGFRLLEAGKGDVTGTILSNIYEAARQAGPHVDGVMAEAFFGLAIKNLQRSADGAISSGAVREAINPVLLQLEKLGPSGEAVLGKFRAILTDLQTAEAGLISAKEVLDAANGSYLAATKAAQEDAAGRFLYNLSGDALGAAGETSVTVNIGRVMQEAFSNPRAPDIIRQTVNQADEANNPLIREGLRSQFLKYLKEQAYTAGNMAPGASRESQAKLGSILNEEGGNNVLSIARELFDEKTYADIVDLLQIQKLVGEGKSFKTSIGSNTAEKFSNKEKVDRLVMLTFGILNPTATKARNLGQMLTGAQADKVNIAMEKTFELMFSDHNFMSSALAKAGQLTEASFKDLATQYFGRGMFRLGIPPLGTDDEAFLNTDEQMTRVLDSTQN